MTTHSNDDWNKSEMSPTWKPENAGDEIVGVLTNKESAIGPNNSMLYTIETKDKHETLSVWGATALDTKMKKVHIGQEVKIVYKGKQKSVKRAGASYKDFEVFYRDAKAADYDFDVSDAAADIFGTNN